MIHLKSSCHQDQQIVVENGYISVPSFPCNQSFFVAETDYGIVESTTFDLVRSFGFDIPADYTLNANSCENICLDLPKSGSTIHFELVQLDNSGTGTIMETWTQFLSTGCFLFNVPFIISQDLFVLKAYDEMNGIVGISNVFPISYPFKKNNESVCHIEQEVKEIGSCSSFDGNITLIVEQKDGNVNCIVPSLFMV